MNIEKLEKILADNNQPKFRLEQIIKAIYQDGISSFSEISNLPKDLREILDEKMKILSFAVENILISKDGNSVKALLKFPDGNKTETVLISPRPEIWSVCVSCQIGCPMNCAFCATGQGGFQRNLTAEEIADQVLFWKQYLKKNIAHPLSRRDYAPPSPASGRGGILTNIVFMGMGEPFLNWEEVKKSLEILLDEKYFNFGSRSISISTVGIPKGIEKSMKDFPQINLAVSLHFADNALRGKFMPANKNFNLDDLKNDLEKYFTKCKRKVFLEYILFSGLNDDKKSAQKLVMYIKSFRTSYLLHVNLIGYNLTNGQQSKVSNLGRAVEFRNYLLEKNINCTIRKSLGDDIQGACGQLAGKKYEKK